MLGVVGSSFKLEPTTPNMSQHGGQTRTTHRAQQCYNMLRWRVAIVWSGLICDEILTANYVIAYSFDWLRCNQSK